MTEDAYAYGSESAPEEAHHLTEPHGAVAEHAEHSPYLRHHFDNMEQQFDSATLGMWVFLLTEIMFFGGMFGAYTVYRSMYPEAFASTSMHMNPAFGAANTAVLIVSSLTMALAVRVRPPGQSKSHPNLLDLDHDVRYRVPGDQGL